MLGNTARDTKPELAIRRAVHRLGLRYRVDARPLPQLNRRADLVFVRARVAVFIDGCFWHGCAEHYVASRSNADYWRLKIERNATRDRDTDAQLTAGGWTVLRFWEHENPVDASLLIERVVRGRR